MQSEKSLLVEKLTSESIIYKEYIEALEPRIFGSAPRKREAKIFTKGRAWEEELSLKSSQSKLLPHKLGLLQSVSSHFLQVKSSDETS